MSSSDLHCLTVLLVLPFVAFSFGYLNLSVCIFTFTDLFCLCTVSFTFAVLTEYFDQQCFFCNFGETLCFVL